MKSVCVVTTSLSRGGAEISSAILTQILFKLGYDVYIIMTKNELDHEFSGKLFNLEKEYGKKLSDFKKLKILKSYFNTHSFDVIIDNRTRPTFFKEYIMYNYVFKAKKKISVVRSYNLKSYFPDFIFQAKLIYNRTSTIVAVSKAIKKVVKKKYSLDDVEQIYNPVDIKNISKKGEETINIGDTFVLWYGRIDQSSKNFTLLLRAYKNSILPDKNIKLYIIGEGNDSHVLNEQIKEFELEGKICRISFLKNPFPFVKRAKFTVLTSYYEGFPRVLIESLAIGTPVISVDCKSGPNEIIQHKYNGLLVENHNEIALAKAFNSFIENDSLYFYCKENAKASVIKFSIENISKDWFELLE